MSADDPRALAGFTPMLGATQPLGAMTTDELMALKQMVDVEIKQRHLARPAGRPDTLEARDRLQLIIERAHFYQNLDASNPDQRLRLCCEDVRAFHAGLPADLSARAAHLLALAGCASFDDVRLLGLKALTGIPNHGKRTLREISDLIGGWT